MTLSTLNLLSGLDAGDRLALFTRFEGAGETPCQYDKEDHRFVLKGNETKIRIFPVFFLKNNCIISSILLNRSITHEL